MDKMTLLFDEFIMKAVTMTEAVMAEDYRDSAKLDFFTQNRERLLAVVDQISQQIDWNTVESEVRNELFRKIDYIKALDEKLIVKLQEYQAEVKLEVEQAFKQKENIKGYNLSDVK